MLSVSSDGLFKLLFNKLKNEWFKLSFKDEICIYFIGRWFYDFNNNMLGGVISEVV